MMLVGCPVSHRAWVLPTWYEHVERACAEIGEKPEYVFVLDPNDRSTAEIVLEHPPVVVFQVDEDRSADVRDWSHDRFAHMAQLRNHLLSVVREIEPEFFLSLDSDILLHPDALKNLIQSTERFDAVGGATFMTGAGTSCPSFGLFTRDGLRRDLAGGVFPVDVIMAIKLMKPAAYAVPYVAHKLGEDIGWSKNCTAAGVKLGFDGRAYSKHVMSPAALGRTDPRVGY